MLSYRMFHNLAPHYKYKQRIIKIKYDHNSEMYLFKLVACKNLMDSNL